MFMGKLWRNLIYLPTVITPVAMITVWTQYALSLIHIFPVHGAAE